MLKRLNPPAMHEQINWRARSKRKRVGTGNYSFSFYSAPGGRGAAEWSALMSHEDALRIQEAAKETPQEIAAGYWWFRDWLYKTAEPDLTSDDVRALALEQENRKSLRLEKAHALMAMREQLDSRAKRQPIPQQVTVLVWQRDSGRCVDCGSQKELEYDHVIPLAMGGSNTDRNLELLCAPCNRRKGATLG